MTVYVVLDRCEGFSYTLPELYIVGVYLHKEKAEARAKSDSHLCVVERVVEDEVRLNIATRPFFGMS